MQVILTGTRTARPLTCPPCRTRVYDSSRPHARGPIADAQGRKRTPRYATRTQLRRSNPQLESTAHTFVLIILRPITPKTAAALPRNDFCHGANGLLYIVNSYIHAGRPFCHSQADLPHIWHQALLLQGAQAKAASAPPVVVLSPTMVAATAAATAAENTAAKK